MAQQINKLDDIQIKSWISKRQPVAKSDGGGLTFTLSKLGTASWVLRYRIGGGQRRELTIGNYPDISLAAARKIAREKRAEIDQGADPALAKKIKKLEVSTSWTVNRLADDYKKMRLIEPEYAEGTIYYRKADLDKVICPKLGTLDVTAVMPSHIVHILTENKRSWTICRRIFTTAKMLFDHACGKRIIDANPCAGINIVSILGPRPTVRKRIMLDENELRVLLLDIEDIGVENALAFKILLATCVRSIELVRCKKEHINLDAGTWWVPDMSVKTRKGFLVPIAPTVKSWIKDLIDLSGDSQWLLPARTERRFRAHGDTHVGETTLWAAINRAFLRGGIPIRRFTPHDTRSTAKGHMRNMGVSREISEIALNHTLKGMEAVYDVREEIPERRKALELWAKFIESCESGPLENAED